MEKVLNREKVIKNISKRVEMDPKRTADVVDALLEYIMTSVAEGQRVRFFGFGSWQIRIRKARKGRNPHTGEAIALPEMALPSFKPGKNFRDAVKQ